MTPNAHVERALASNRLMLIDGKLVAADGERAMEVVSPVDGTTKGDVPCATAGDVGRAVSAASKAFDAWRWTDLSERRRCLLALAAHVRDDSETLAVLDTIDSGSTLQAMRADMEYAAFSIEYFAGLAFEWGGRQVPSGTRSIDVTMREPYGVTARIVAFNHPLLFAASKIAAPLLTGNTVVLKLPDQTPLSGLRLCEALAEIFPPGVVNVITGVGREAGDALVRHPDVRRIGFIGSVPTGKAILRAAADNVVPVTAELGGKNALIVCADADVDEAVRAAVKGMNFKTQGQSCSSYSWVFLHDRVYDQALALLAKSVEAVRVRNPFDPEADMGALISEEARERAERYIATACDAGADLVTGGERPAAAELERGWYLEPAVVTGVTPSMPVAHEEVFGPVLAVSRWTDVHDVVTEANATPYGLTGAVWTRDLDRALRIAQDLEVGSVAVNGDGSQHWFGAPFGGYKHSGYGKEESLEEVIDSTRMKNVNITIHDHPEGERQGGRS